MIYKYLDECRAHLRLAKRWHEAWLSVRSGHYAARQHRDMHLEAARSALDKHYDLNGR